MRKFIESLVPFFFVGVALVAFTFGLILLAYLFLFGALAGIVLFAINWIRRKLASKESLPTKPAQKKDGRVIDINDWKEL